MPVCYHSTIKKTHIHPSIHPLVSDNNSIAWMIAASTTRRSSSFHCYSAQFPHFSCGSWKTMSPRSSSYRWNASGKIRNHVTHTSFLFPSGPASFLLCRFTRSFTRYKMASSFNQLLMGLKIHPSIHISIQLSIQIPSSKYHPPIHPNPPIHSNISHSN